MNTTIDRAEVEAAVQISEGVMRMIAGFAEYSSWGPPQEISPWDSGEVEYQSWNAAVIDRAK